MDKLFTKMARHTQPKLSDFMSRPIMVLLLCLTTTTTMASDAGDRSLFFKPEKTNHRDFNFKVKTEDTWVPFPFRNSSLPWSVRVDDLVSRLDVQEIVLQMSRGGTGRFGGPAPAIPRLGIGTYSWNTECLRGDVNPSGNATAFPQALGLAATFSADLIYRVANATSTEVRGKHNEYVKKGISTTHTGTSCFSPVINIMRDPRWGRNQETYGEDPFLSGELAKSYVEGLQGTDQRFVRASAGCKHLDVYAGPEDIPVSRFSFDAKVSDRDWRMTFLPAFKKCVEAKTFSFMCSYNRINGIPACANRKLLTDILRNEWGFTGYVISDQGAIENIISDHHYLNNSVDTAAACVNAGCNLELASDLVNPVFMSLAKAVEEGKVTETVLRERVKPLFYTRMRLGEFDPPGLDPWAFLDNSDVETAEHQALAVEAAVKSFVLLKNSNRVLPLSVKPTDTVAILGPMANDVGQIFGDYSPTQSRSFTKTPLQGLSSAFKSVRYNDVCFDGTPCDVYQKSVLPSIVPGSDVIFLCLGTGPIIEAEAKDRPDTDLPGYQKDLVLDVIKYRTNNTPIILLLFSAGPLNVSFADELDSVAAILQCFFPAQATGDALLKTLVVRDGHGVVSPAGRLPYTWPRLASEIPPMVNYSMVGRTYRYMQATPLYPFGYGLSYTSFHYSNFTHPTQVKAEEKIVIAFTVENTGKLGGDEVVQCYVRWQDQSLPVPRLQLALFDRLYIPAGSSSEVKAIIPWDTLAYWDDDNDHWKIPTGTVNIYCGGQQPLQAKRVPSNILKGQITLTSTR